MAAGAGAEHRRRPPSSGRRSGSPGRTRWPCAPARSCATTSCWSPASPARACGWSWTACRSGAATTSPIKQLVEDFARYLYLPRLKDPRCCSAPSATGSALLTWEQDAFAYADSYDEAAGRYRGLRGGQNVSMLDQRLARPARKA